MMPLPVFKHPDFANAPNVSYGFYTRRGGQSKGVYDALNCGIGSGDDINAVLHNRGLIARDLGATHDVVMGSYQEHGNKCIKVEGLDQRNHINRPHADALVTDRPDTPIGVLTADCVPVLFYASTGNKTVIGAAHAGWRGAYAGILQNTVLAMCAYEGIAPEDLSACIGPSVTKNSYEVDESFRNKFIARSQSNAVFFSPGRIANKFYFDLSGCCVKILKETGVSNVSVIDADTYTGANNFFSYRRATHDGSATQGYGRQLSAIMIKK